MNSMNSPEKSLLKKYLIFEYYIYRFYELYNCKTIRIEILMKKYNAINS